MDTFKEKLAKLKEQRKRASRDNFREVLEENERMKRPANWEKKIERNMKRLQEEEAKQKAEEVGQDYEVIKGMNYRADEVEKWERSRANGKRVQVNGFTDFEDATKRQYGRFVKQHKPDLDKYNKLKSELDDKFQLKDSASKSDEIAATSASSSAMDASLPKDTPEGIERMAEAVHKEIEIRSKRSRRRKFNDDDDVNYINERNKKFNEKLERFYGSYTDEIKKNFERGTAM